MCRNNTNEKMGRNKHFFIIICMFMLLVYLHYVTKKPLSITYHTSIINDYNFENHSIKYMYLWNGMFDRRWYLNKDYVDANDFESFKCPQTKCVVTTRQSVLPHIYMFDAIIFHGAKKWSKQDLIPTERNINQLYVVGIQESPTYTTHNLRLDANFYNWTMTYRLDSDVIAPYAYVVDIESNSRVAPSKTPNWRTPDDDYFDSKLYELATNKTEKIAWFVSNCNAESERERLAKSIQQHMTVDIYGKCGPFKCDSPKNSSQTDPCKLLLNNYKFYLSFENSLWQDYVTEKLFKIMENNLIIPIVYGGANYNHFVPPKSYINANDFSNVNELMDYLLYLDSNPNEYIKYFWWRKYYKIIQQGSITKFCELCVKLHETSVMTMKKQYYDIYEWWFQKAKKMIKPVIQF